MSWSTSELRVRLAPLNWFKPSSKIFYWRFQGGTSFVEFLCFCSVLCLLCLCTRLFILALCSPAGKGLTSWLSFVVSAVSLLLSHWYPGSGVVLDCIDSWSLHPYLLWCYFSRHRHFHQTKKHNVEQARKAMHVLFKRIRNLDIPIDLQLYLFDHVMLPKALYGCEIWGFENSQIIENLHNDFLRQTINLRKSTPFYIYVLHAELGRNPNTN